MRKLLAMGATALAVALLLHASAPILEGRVRGRRMRAFRRWFARRGRILEAAVDGRPTTGQGRLAEPPARGGHGQRVRGVRAARG